MPKSKTAADLMTRPINWVTPGATLREAAGLMVAKNFSQLPVQDGQRNAGRVTDLMISDILIKASGPEVATLKVRDLPPSGSAFPTVESGTPFEKCAELLRKDQALLVRPGNDLRDWGIITRFDLLRELL
jgi:predicted transcriptional regulator